MAQIFNCQKCGTELPIGEKICPKCKTEYINPKYQNKYKEKIDGGSLPLALICTLFFPLGIIFGFLLRRSQPRKAKSCIKGAVAGFLLYAILGITLGILIYTNVI